MGYLHVRLLAPLREYVARHRPPQSADRLRLHGHFVELALDHADKVGRAEGAEAVARLLPDAANTEAVLLDSLTEKEPRSAIRVSIAWGEFVRFVGAGSPRPLEAALRAAEALQDKTLEADCIQCLGDIALERSDHEGARGRYEAALPLYRKVGSVLGEANCIQSLGDMALERSDHEGAHGQFEIALELYERIAEPYSIGRTHRRLARVARGDEERKRHVQAARRAWESIQRPDLIAGLLAEFPEVG